LFIDTDNISVSEVITEISKSVEIKDISVSGDTIDQTVVSLYKEFEI